MEKTISFKEYLDRFNIKRNSVVTIGNFDGLHLGHMQLIERTVEIAKEENLISIIFSYEVHPQNVLYKKLVHLIMPHEEKERILFEKGINTVLFVPFDEQLQNQSARQFCDEVLIGKLKAKYLVMGEDARFGKEMLSAQEIKQYLEAKGVKVDLIPLLKIDNERISSTGIRDLVEQGNLAKASQYLGRPFSIIGKVVHGKKIGKSIGFPTANIELEKDQVLPECGVYETVVYYKEKVYKGATSVGKNPTFGQNPVTVETYILDFDENIYGRTIKLEFVRKLRGEIAFSSKEELVEQMKDDVRRIGESN